MSLQDGLLYAVAPAAAGFAFALVPLLSARRQASLPPEQQGPAMVFLAIPMTAVILAFVAANMAASASGLRTQLLAMGAASFACAAAQGFLGARALRAVAKDPAHLGRALIPVAAIEALPVLALLWVLTSAQGAAL